MTAGGLGWTRAYRQSSVWAWQAELRGLWNVGVPSLLLFRPAPTSKDSGLRGQGLSNVGLRDLPTLLRMRSPSPEMPEEKDTQPKVREKRQEYDPNHHILQHEHLEKHSPESISPTCAGIKHAPS